MFADSITLGASPNNLVFAKRFADQNLSRYSVAGLAATAARTLSVSHQPSTAGRTRSMWDLSETDVDPASATGATQQSRLYIVLDRSSFKSAADVKAMFARLKTFVDSTPLQDQFLNQEV